ncbi:MULTISPECIES: glycerophosphodiester phosphodiesterase family protein [Pseudomonas]|jgi:glycerophosphoryl diester phosphodiesterase|uniref:glycerophosphodiester phosphodiesterase family protein n=1 Tax=Pseudomonas TaxID=286 RepID=UPI001AE26598|nr:MULTISPECIES: glycerophosphodiester phosphodiesterase family protein [unclassified Pseudomonas]MBP1124691.1 glycerophosphoryl diester phosphodiesterase [Pseudomonas sp. PvP025]MDQ0398551.1 glycerophosphoryl diester phosphodiesterase [Pseudomonas sp. PvP006]
MKAKSRVVQSNLIAHRGASAFAPENTLEAIELAARMGAQWVEIDVKLTRDGALVVIHDDTLDRTTSGQGAVVLNTLEHIRSLDAGRWFSSTYAGVAVPTFEEVVDTVIRLGLGLQVELKPTTGDDLETAEAAIPLLRQKWPRDHHKLFVSSFSTRALGKARALWEEVPLCLASLVAPADPATLLAEYDCQILHVVDPFLNECHLSRLRDSAVEFAVATVNDPHRARYLLSRGAQSVITDYPNLLDINARQAGM